MNVFREVSKYREPDSWIRYEHMEEDLLKLDHVRNDPEALSVISTLKNNIYMDEDYTGILCRNPKNPRYSDYLSYYDQSDLDHVYNKYVKIFEKFGYQREFKDQGQPS